MSKRLEFKCRKNKKSNKNNMPQVKYHILKNENENFEFDGIKEEHKTFKIPCIFKWIFVLFVFMYIVYIRTLLQTEEYSNDLRRTSSYYDNVTAHSGSDYDNFSDRTDNYDKVENNNKENFEYSSTVSVAVNEKPGGFTTVFTTKIDNVSHASDETSEHFSYQTTVSVALNHSDYDHADDDNDDSITTQNIINVNKTRDEFKEKSLNNLNTATTHRLPLFTIGSSVPQTATENNFENSTISNEKQKVTNPIVNFGINSTPSVIYLNSTNVQKYYINTSQCRMPYIDPFSAEALKIYKPSKKKLSPGCAKDKAIIEASYDAKNRQYSLHINYKIAADILIKRTNQIHLAEENLLCCYQQIVRSGSGNNADASFKLLPCANFHQDFIVPKHINGMIVKCTEKSSNKTLQEDAFSFVQMMDLKSQSSQQQAPTIPAKRKVGVLLIGIDSMSRINVRRTMPDTIKYIEDNKWFELRGYNKVGDNTFPNLMPLLTGYTRTTSWNKCSPKTVGGLNNCNFIWSKYKEQGYTTAYAEDTATISTFNYHIKGFKKPPTDYYFRPFALGIEKTMATQRKAGLIFCVGRRQYGEYVYEYGRQFIDHYQNVSHFGMFWTNSFSHNAFDIAATMDTYMLNYLRDLGQKNVLETSVVIFFSDHGRRWGPLLKLTEGYLEERLPMFFISLPKWFQSEYPDLVENLKINRKRLTTPFDIQITLQHLLKLSNSSFEITPALDCPKAQSIFTEVAENRNCDDACIPQTWCTCKPFKIVSTKNKTVKKITQLIIDKLNHYIADKNITSICADLKLHDISNAQLRYEDQMAAATNVSTYMIQFATNPKTDPRAAFSATTDFDSSTGVIHLDVEDISRLSKYENTAKCIDDKIAKKYCSCKNSVKNS